ncbi:MAG: hypothetical protein MMC33_008772 [Icmadophila ericetorum]|nr:hypothetical protein [Icmadophila ericetorum]
MSGYDDSNTSGGYGSGGRSQGGYDDNMGGSGGMGGQDNLALGNTNTGSGGLGSGRTAGDYQDTSSGTGGMGGSGRDTYGSSNTGGMGSDTYESSNTGGMGGGNTYDSSNTGGMGGGNTYDSLNTTGGLGGGRDTYESSNTMGGAAGGYGQGNSGTGTNYYGSSGDKQGKSDSTMGKFMEKAGNVMGNEKIAQKGAEKRQQAGGYGDNQSGGYGGSNTGSEQADKIITQLVQRFENLVALAPLENYNRLDTAVTAYQVEVETAALIKAAEDVLLLTRSLKEAWLFGPLDTMRESQAEAKTEEHARAVAEGLKELLEKEKEKESGGEA